jgi:ABC-type uncharacterized transport system permease subunit
VKYINQIIKKIRCCVSGFLLAGACFAAFSSFATQSVTLAWVSSASPTVAGYKIYYWAASDSVTNVIAVGTVTNAVITGLQEGETYHFFATAFDSDSNAESDPSNITAYTVPDLATLEIQVSRQNGVATSVSVTAGGAIPDQWVLESSADLQHWAPALHGTNSAVSFTMPVSGLPAQFFRLKAE